MKYNTILTTAMAGLLLMGCAEGTSESQKAENREKAEALVSLGEKLYHDKTLSKNRTMACATCHVIENAMVDPRETSRDFGASLGDDGVSIGDRSAPTAAYASFSPGFHFDTSEEGGVYVGGQFLDGRANDLKAQAKGPFLNPLEMGMPTAASVIARIQENADYTAAFKRLYGDRIFDNTDEAYDAVAEAIANFEKSNTFAPFNSKYDKVLQGEAALSKAEKHGLQIFNGKGTCSACHPSHGKHALFTDFTFDNIGVPVNHALRAVNGLGEGHIDNGLYDNPRVDDESLKGAFKVSTLRNIAVTAPYMHNGVFKTLKTVVHFYNTRDVPGAINPDTGAPWEKGELEANKNVNELGNLKLTDAEEDDLVAFLKTLTDEKYEHLIP